MITSTKKLMSFFRLQAWQFDDEVKSEKTTVNAKESTVSPVQTSKQ